MLRIELPGLRKEEMEKASRNVYGCGEKGHGSV